MLRCHGLEVVRYLSNQDQRATSMSCDVQRKRRWSELCIFFWILSVVDLWLLLLVQHDKDKGYRLCFSHGWKTFHFYLRKSPSDFWVASGTWRKVITCTHLFVVSCRERGLNSNTFLDSSDCFVCLRKNSLPVSVVMTNHRGALLVNVKRTLEQIISLQQSYASLRGNWGPRKKNRVVLHAVKMASLQVYDIMTNYMCIYLSELWYFGALVQVNNLAFLVK